MSTTALAHPNIALVKYWGKQDAADNIPAAPSLSITLDTLHTTTQVAATTGADQIYLNDKVSNDNKISACLDEIKRAYAIPFLEVHTRNNFPTAAGLASSASGFAALVTAINGECELGLTPQTLSSLARQASGSAARSVFGGFVALEGPDWQARQVMDTADWPLRTIVAITTTAPKSTSSSAGMRLSRDTSAYYDAWVSSTHDDFQVGLAAVQAKDFAALADIAEISCLKMHGLMLSSGPGLIYWNPATVACIHAIRTLRHAGLPVFFTVDAGPQVKAVCLPEAEEPVREALQSVAGVQRVLVAGLGTGARIIEP